MSPGSLRAAVRVVRQSKKQARGLLDTGSNRLWLALSVVLWIVTAGAIYMLGAGLLYAADGSIFTDQPSALAVGMTVLSYALMLLLAILLLLPMTGGVLLLARYIYEGKRLEAGDMLAAFGSVRQYARCMGIGAYSLLQPVLIAAILLLGCIAVPSAIAQALRDAGARIVLVWLACSGVILVCAVLALAVMIAFRAAFLKSAFLARGASWHEACLRTGEILSKNGSFAFYYRLSFLGHVALCVLTVGASGVIDGVGHALLCNQYACDAFESQEN